MAKTSRDKAKKQDRYASAKERADTHSTGYARTTLKLPEGVKFFDMKKAGTYRIDIIPYICNKPKDVPGGNPFVKKKGQLYYERTFYMHRDIGPTEDSYICLAETFGEPCPVCQHRMKLQRDPRADEDKVKALYPKERQLFNVIDHSDLDAGVQLWDISFFLFGKALDAKIRNADEDDNYDSFWHLEDGLVLKLGAEEKTMGKKGKPFRSVEDIEFKPRKEQYGEDILEKAYNLDDLLAKMEFAELKKIFQQEPPEDDDDDKEDKGRKKKLDKEDSSVEEASDEDSSVEKSSAAGEEDAKEVTAEDKGIKKGVQVKHEKFGVCEVLSVSGDGTSIKIKDGKGKTRWPISPDELELVKKSEDDSSVEEPSDEEDSNPDSSVEDSSPEDEPKKKPAKKPKGDDEDEPITDSSAEEPSEEEEPEEKPAPKKKSKK